MNSSVGTKVENGGINAQGRLGAPEVNDIVSAINSKQDAQLGFGLSTNDYTTAEKNKLAAMAAGATQNQTDAFLLARANHTGSQLSTTISDFNTAVNTLVTALRNANNGLAPLDSTGRLPVANMPASFTSDQGLTDAANITPDAALAGIQEVTITASRTMSNLVNGTFGGQRVIFAIKQGAGSTAGAGYVITWDTNYRFGTTYPVTMGFSDNAGAVDYYTFIWNASASKWDCVNIALNF